MERRGRAILVPLPGSKLRKVGMWGLGAGGVGGLGLDALTLVFTGGGDEVRVLLSAGLSLASALLVVLGFAVDARLRGKYERGGGGA